MKCSHPHKLPRLNSMIPQKSTDIESTWYSYRKNVHWGSSCGPHSPRPHFLCTSSHDGLARRGSNGRRSLGVACKNKRGMTWIISSSRNYFLVVLDTFLNCQSNTVPGKTVKRDWIVTTKRKALFPGSAFKPGRKKSHCGT